MIEQQARVINIKDNHLVLEAEIQSSCSACNVRNGCGTSVLEKWVGGKFTHFNAKNTVNAKIGDQVIVGLSEQALLSGSLAVYLWPLLGMLGFALVADLLLNPDVDYRDQIIVVSAMAGFVCSLGLCRRMLAMDKFKERFSPVILRRLPEKLSSRGYDQSPGHGRIVP